MISLLLASALAFLMSPAAALDDWPLAGISPDGRLGWIVVPEGAALAADLPAPLLNAIELPGKAGTLVAAWRQSAAQDPLALLLAGPWELSLYQTEGHRLAGKGTRRQVLLVTAPSDRPQTETALEDLVTRFGEGGQATTRGRYRGVPYQRLGRDLVTCWLGDALLVATSDDLVADAVDRALDPARSSNATQAPTRVELALALEAVQSEDLRGLRPSRKRVTRDALPVWDLLVGPLASALDGEGWCKGSVQHGSGAVELLLELPPLSAEHEQLLHTGSAANALSVPVTSQTLGIVAARRDLADAWRRREELAAEQLQPRLAKLDGEAGMLFSGRDLAEDVLARFEPEFALVLDGEALEPGAPAPALRLPGACLVLRLRPDAMAFAPLLSVAFQGALGRVNANRAEEGLAPFLITASEHRGVLLQSARLLPGEGSGDGSDDNPYSVEFNLTPSLAVVQDRVLLGTSLTQTRRLVDALLDGSLVSHPSDLVLDLDGAALARTLGEARLPLAGRLVLAEGLDAGMALARVDRQLAELTALGRISADARRGAEGVQVRIGFRAEAISADQDGDR